MAYRLSGYGLGDDGVDGGFHVAWATDNRVGLKLVDARYGTRSRSDLLEAMRMWMELRSTFVGVEGDVVIFESKSYQEMMG